MIRSLSGWTEISKTKTKGGIHVKNDERILGESTFVSDILSQANEKYERKYELKRRGYDLRARSKITGTFPRDKCWDFLEVAGIIKRPSNTAKNLPSFIEHGLNMTGR